LFSPLLPPPLSPPPPPPPPATPPPPGRTLRRLFLGARRPARAHIAIVAAHPDDEIIGAGAQFSRWRNLEFIHVTDGAPRNLRDALAAGFAHRKNYALARKRELESALALAGLASAPRLELGFADQGASRSLVKLTRALMEAIRAIQPEALITHPYEGGHPDHDATAFAVHAACRLLLQAEGPAPEILEMTSYHNRAGIMVTGEFLPCADRQARTLRLTKGQRALKRQMFECFTTQEAVLRAFKLDCERFRPAPHYDFTQPPHPGPLYYERFDWGMTGARWRRLAKQALAELGMLEELVSGFDIRAGRSLSPSLCTRT
jgi:N-acetylglucosamine malate deacetylase 2